LPGWVFCLVHCEGTLTMPTVLALPVAAQTIWETLHPIRGGRYQQPSWAECLAFARRYPGSSVIGDVILIEDARREDFTSLLQGRQLRVVVLPSDEGYQLRWSDATDADRLKLVLGGIYHADLLRAGDEGLAARSGWLVVSENGLQLM
jgi:hypothetical protein